MLSITGLRVEYGGVPALRGVDLTVADGEIVGLVGPNGAGKSTTLSAVFGLVRPAAGSVTLDGQSLAGMKPEQVVRLGVALVPEGRHIFGSLTVAENLLLGAIPRSDAEAVEADRERFLDLFPILRSRYRSLAGLLSGGEQQQLAIARALLSGPRLLLLDEPSLGLAPRAVEQVLAVLDGLRASGVTILLVEQNALQTVRLADRSYVLRTGEITLAGSREALLANPEFESLYLGF